jgi:hypothetical protein
LSTELSSQASHAADIVRNHVATWAIGTYSIEYDGPSRSEFGPYDDYVVEWELVIRPTRDSACPLELWFLGGCPSLASVGFGFDTWSDLAYRVGKKSENSRFVFGSEPFSVTEEQLRAVLAAVYEGRVEARYLSVFGRLFEVNGRLLTNVGIPEFEKRRFGTQHQYSPYGAA